MSSVSVFISRLRGLPVLDASGDPVGKVRDVVIQLRAAGRGPRCRGLVVDFFARRRIFIPMARVHAIEASHVAIHGTVDTRPFQRREAEFLVMDDLFDRLVEHAGKQGHIHDVAMTQVRNRDWEITEVAIREEVAGKRRFRIGARTGPIIQLPWSQVAASVMAGEQSTDHLVAELMDMKPADVARELYDLDPERRAEVAAALDDDTLADAIEELPEDEQIELISALDTERAADVLGEMDPDDAADLIRDLPSDVGEYRDAD